MAEQKEPQKYEYENPALMLLKAFLCFPVFMLLFRSVADYTVAKHIADRFNLLTDVKKQPRK